MVKDLKILEGRSIYDIANDVLGGFDNIYAGIIQINPVIESIDFDLNTIATQSIRYDDAYYSTPILQIQLDVKLSNPVTEFKGLENQSIFDAVLMTYGNLGNTFDFIKENGIVSLNNQSIALKNLIFDTNNVTDISLFRAIKSKRYVFASLFKNPNSFLLQENGFYILQENGYKIKIS